MLTFILVIKIKDRQTMSKTIHLRKANGLLEATSIMVGYFNERSKKEIVSLLRKMGGKAELGTPFQDRTHEFVTITYDGGTHPDYASNVFSTVDGVRLTDGDKDYEVETEDAVISSDSMLFDDKMQILHALVTYAQQLNLGWSPDMKKD